MRTALPLLAVILFFCGSTLLSAEKQQLPAPRSVCLLKSPLGSGSGFFTSLDNQDVLVTNNHVILELPEVKIRDINGALYEYCKVYSSPDRDLAVIPLRRVNHADMPNLPILKQPDMLPVNTKITAYGDSLGAGVIVSASGKYLGIGPEIIEVDSPFVSGNSGGPVLENQSGKVIGVATYCRIMPETQKTAHGSRFEAKRHRPAIRRFATRIDNISLAGFEVLTPEQIQQDQKNIQELNQTFEQLTQTLEKQQPVPQTISQLIRILENWSGEMPAQWHSAYMKTTAAKKWQLLNDFRNTFFANMKSRGLLMTDPRIKNIWNKYLPEISFKKNSAVTRPCLACRGTGRIALSKNQQHSRKLQTTGSKTCYLCQQSGKNTLRQAKDYAILPAEFSRELSKAVTPEKQRFYGFEAGSLFRTDGVLKKAPGTHCGVFTIYRITGSHDMAETRIWLVGSLLMRIDRIMPENDFTPALKRKIQQDFSAMEQAEINIVPVSKFNSSHKLNAENELAIREYLRQAAAADSSDPFGIFYTEKSLQPKKFIQISFRHKNFSDCRNLIHLSPGQAEKMFTAGQ